ncbi:MAG TPA: hypothetical protein ENI86_09130 [Acidimicrobiales bacterium]|nr:hypothetical protein [Acidimicrobiales bacterium]
MAVVMVTDAARGSAVAIIRSLLAAGHTVLAGDVSRLAPGLHCRGLHHGFRYPDPTRHGSEYRRTVLAVAAEFGADLLIPVTDATTEALGPDRKLPHSSCRVLAPEPEVLDRVHDKNTLLTLAADLGVPVPRTLRVTSRSDPATERFGQRAGWPVVVKPERSTVAGPHGKLVKLEVSYATDPDQLAGRVAEVLPHCPALLQEYFPGEGHGVEVLAHRGRILAAFQHHRLREVPFTGGASSFRRAVEPDPRLLEHTATLIAATKWTGLAMVEFKVAPDQVRLMEINGRVWGSLPLAVAAGMDFPARLVDLAINGPQSHPAELALNGPRSHPVDTDYRRGTTSRNLGLEITWGLTALRDGRRSDGLRVLASLADPGPGYDIVRLSDPVPGLYELVTIARHLTGKAIRVLRR